MKCAGRPTDCASDSAASPVFNMPWEQLQDYWNEMIGGQRRIARAAAEPARQRYIYIQHSAWLRFPDIVAAEFVTESVGRSVSSWASAAGDDAVGALSVVDAGGVGCVGAGSLPHATVATQSPTAINRTALSIATP